MPHPDGYGTGVDIESRIERNEAEYVRDADDERPLGSYAVLLAAYGTVAGAAALIGRERLPADLSAADLALGAVSTFKLSRVLTEDTITSPIRAPFTRFEGVSGPSELDEEVRGRGMRHAVGELLTCPFCVSQWVATILIIGLVAAPRLTRTAMTVLAMVTASDFLHLAFTKASQAVGEA